MKLQNNFYRICFIALAFFELTWGIYMDYFSLYNDPNDGFKIRVILSVGSLILWGYSYHKSFSKSCNFILGTIGYLLAAQQLYYCNINADNYQVLFAATPPILMSILFMPTRITLISLTILINIFAFFIPQDNYYLSFNLFTYSIMFCIFKVFFIMYTEELVRKQSEDKKQENIRALGDFTRGISHELNNQTTKLHLSAEWLSLNVNNNERVVNKILNLKEQINNMAIVTNKLKKLSRATEDFNKREISLENLAKRIEKIHQPLFDSVGVDLHIDINSDKGEVLSIDDQIVTRTVNELIKNAHESFLPGEINKFVKIDLWIKNNDLIIEVSNNGVGIPDEIKDFIFNGFFTTKDIGKNTGLGLTMALKNIYKHKGTLKLESSDEFRTTFQIVIPKK